MTDGECICEGNWRAIVNENERFIGDEYEAYGWPSGRWRFFGIVHGGDDYYYGMSRPGEHVLLSCVGSLETWGFKWVACGHMWRGDPDAVETHEKCVKCDERREREIPY